MLQELITENYLRIKSKLPQNIQLVVVSKTQTIEDINIVYQSGQRVFGENRVQEVVEKNERLPQNIQWHFIGHLQTNKVKYIAEFIDTIQSVDSEKVLKEINTQAKKHKRIIKVLLQVKIAEEESKYGLEVNETREIFLKWRQGEFPNVEITGLMGMATFTEDKKQIRREFDFLKHLFDQLSQQKKLETLSMGMSGDYLLAIESGANSVRIGSAIFGERNLN